MGFGELYAIMEESIKIYTIRKLMRDYALDPKSVYVSDDYLGSL